MGSAESGTAAQPHATEGEGIAPERFPLLFHCKWDTPTAWTPPYAGSSPTWVRAGELVAQPTCNGHCTFSPTRSPLVEVGRREPSMFPRPLGYSPFKG